MTQARAHRCIGNSDVFSHQPRSMGFVGQTAWLVASVLIAMAFDLAKSGVAGECS